MMRQKTRGYAIEVIQLEAQSCAVVSYCNLIDFRQILYWRIRIVKVEKYWKLN